MTPADVWGHSYYELTTALAADVALALPPEPEPMSETDLLAGLSALAKSNPITSSKGR